MKSWSTVAFAFFCLASLSLWQVPLLAQPPGTVGLVFEQRTNDGVNVSYALRVDAFQLFFTALPGQLIAPDGTIFERQINSVSNLSFADIGNRFFGNWTIAERTAAGNANHTFTFNGFVLTDVFTEIPRIVAPVPSGQSGIVDPSFNIVWNYASGAMPAGNTVVSSNSGGTLAFSPPTMNNSQATATLNAGVSQADFTISAGSFNSLNSFAGSVIRDANGLGNNWSRAVSFRNLSQPIQVTVVPEPNAMAILSLSCLAVAVRRRRDRGMPCGLQCWRCLSQ